VSDTLGLVEPPGTGGGRGPGVVARGAFAVEVDGADPDPEREVAIFIILENLLPFFTFASVSVKGAGEGSVGGAVGRGRSLREESMASGAAFAFGVGAGETMGGGRWFCSGAASATGSSGGDAGTLLSENLRVWVSGVGGRDDRGTGGRARWRGPGGGTGGGSASSCLVGSAVCAISCETSSGGCDSCSVASGSSSSSTCGSTSVRVSTPTSSYVLRPRSAKYWHGVSAATRSGSAGKYRRHLKIRKRGLCFRQVRGFQCPRYLP
jgi:hypothetical protein